MSVTAACCGYVCACYMLEFGARQCLLHPACSLSTAHVKWKEVGWPFKQRAMQCTGMLTSRAENAAWIVGV